MKNKYEIKIEMSSSEEEGEKVQISIPSKKKDNKRVKYDYSKLDEETEFVSVIKKRSDKEFLKEPTTQPTQPQTSPNTIDPMTTEIIVCFPNSILETGQTKELEADMIGKLARQLCIHNVSKVIVLKDHSYQPKSTYFDPSEFILKTLQYLETPQYLRKRLFPICNELRLAGLLPPLECPHHLREQDQSKYREGVVLNRPVKEGQGSFVDIGLWKDCQIDSKLPTNTRVTVKMSSGSDATSKKNRGYQGTAVSPYEAWRELEKYWGYEVCIADTVSDVIEFSGDNSYKILFDDLSPSFESSHKREIQTKFAGSKKDSILLFFADKGLKHLIQHEVDQKLPLSIIERKFDALYGNWFKSMGVKKLHIQEQVSYFLQRILLD
jgi:predicted SPOUT superfamily RNA methylase MTH1